MDKKPLSTQKKKEHIISIPLILVVGAVLYLGCSLIWLMGVQDIGPVASVVISLVSFIAMTSIALAVYARLTANAKTKGKAQTEPADNNIADDVTKTALRRQTRIESLERDTRATHDRIFQVGAAISLGLTLYALLMGKVFGLSAQEVYFIPWWGLALLWFVQIVFFPRWATYASFLVFCIMRVGVQVFGLSILAMLPNFIMLPIFYLLMMFFMFGSIMLPSLAQVKYNRPGEGDWATPEGATRGQPRARAMFESQTSRIEAYVDGRSKIRPARGILATGEPGTGKTLLAKETATKSRFPFIQATGDVFNPPFMGFAPIMIGWIRSRVEALAREYGWAILFIDECETLFAMRSGMQQPMAWAGQQLGASDFNVTGNDLAMGGTPRGPMENAMFLPGAMGGNAGIYPFLTWMSGVPSPSFTSKLARGIANTLLSVFLPVTAFGKILRLSPAKARESNVLFIGATNRPWMIDPAMKRPGRLEVEAVFEIPDEMSSFDTAQYYIELLHKEGYYRDELLNPDLIWAFARSAPGRSQAEIERAIREAIFVRIQHLADLRRVMKLADKGAFDDASMASLPENERRQREMDRKFWGRHSKEVRDAEGKEIPGCWDERVNWDALVEAQSKISWGAIRPEAIHPKTQEKVSYHEVGHFLMLVALLVKRYQTVPTVLTALPRGEGTLGKVIYQPNDPREMHPQAFYEAAIRVALGAWTAERYCFGQNMPGVSGDLRSATGLSALMLGRFGMPPFRCPESERDRYQRIGTRLISEPESSSFLNPSASALVERALAGNQREQIALMLGMAVVDNYRLLRANQAVYSRIVAELIKNDEISGARLGEVQREILAKLVDFDQMSEKDRSAFPPYDFEVANPFYGKVEAEGIDVVHQVETILEGGQS